MNINKDDLPYLYENVSPWEALANGVEQQIMWEYTIDESAQLELEGSSYFTILERVRRRQIYRFGNYDLVASSVHEWQYLDRPDSIYANIVQGYRGYWEGDTQLNGEPILQPEVAVVLGLTPDLLTVPSYIESVSLEDLQELMDLAGQKYDDDDALAFPKPIPMEAPTDAPDNIRDALRRMRAGTGLKTTRGRAALLEWVMDITGTTVIDGGWIVTEEEIARRKRLGLR